MGVRIKKRRLRLRLHPHLQDSLYSLRYIPLFRNFLKTFHDRVQRHSCRTNDDDEGSNTDFHLDISITYELIYELNRTSHVFD
jgi:hypothetical protein